MKIKLKVALGLGSIFTVEGKTTLDLILHVYGSSLLLILLQRLSGLTKMTIHFKGLHVLQFQYILQCTYLY